MSILSEWVENLYLREAYKMARESLTVDHIGVEMGMVDMWLRFFQHELGRLTPLIPPDDSPTDLSTLAELLGQAAERNKNDYVIRTARARGVAI